MVKPGQVERRRFPRRAMAVPARVALEAGGRTFPCRLADVSAGGARLLLPLTAPVRVGHALAIRADDTPPAAQADLAALTGYAFGPGPAPAEPSGGAIPAVVVRVDRESLLLSGQISVGVRFPLPDPPAASPNSR